MPYLGNLHIFFKINAVEKAKTTYFYGISLLG